VRIGVEEEARPGPVDRYREIDRRCGAPIPVPAMVRDVGAEVITVEDHVASLCGRSVRPFRRRREVAKLRGRSSRTDPAHPAVGGLRVNN
jgi:hypothetical protein